MSRSSVEAKYRVIVRVTVELKWFCSLLRKLRVYLQNTPVIHTTKSAIFMATNPVIQVKTRHLEIDYHFIREFVFREDIRLNFVKSEDQTIDMFTKALPASHFQRHRQHL